MLYHSYFLMSFDQIIDLLELLKPGRQLEYKYIAEGTSVVLKIKHLDCICYRLLLHKI